MTLEQIEQERKAFEEFMRSQNDGDRLELDADGYYADASIEYAWSGWKARASNGLVDTLRAMLKVRLEQTNEDI